MLFFKILRTENLPINGNKTIENLTYVHGKYVQKSSTRVKIFTAGYMDNCKYFQ